jgi:hypothetical protein
MSERDAIAHLEELRKEGRDEIKRRIEQRDKYSIQLTIALAAIVTIAFGSTGFGKALVAAPLVSIYYTVLILYSYRIHRLLATYLREEIEPQIARLCGTPPEKEWETWYREHAEPGIRRHFFVLALWAVCVLSVVYLLVAGGDEPVFRGVFVVAAALYLAAAGLTTACFWKG